MAETTQSIQPSSLDRFMWDRGIKLFDLVGPKNGGTIAFAVNAALHTALSIGFLIASFVNQNADKASKFAIMWPIFLALGIGFGVTTVFWHRRTKRSNRSEIRLSAEGLKLVLKIFNHIGYNQNAHSNTWGAWVGCSKSNRTPPALQWLSDNFGIGRRRTAADVLQPESYTILDRAAFAYNRANGVLQARSTSTPESLTRLRGSIHQAADEAMVAVVNQIATLERMPESANAITRQVEKDLKALEELADRVETIAAQQPSFVESAGSSSAMLGVLEQLRLDQAARAELLHSPDEEQSNYHST